LRDEDKRGYLDSIVKVSKQEISRDELASRLGEPNQPLVIDVLPEEEFAAAHLPGAKNACIFNVSFLDDVRNLASDQSKPLVLYGASLHDLASATATEKLLAAGYTDVTDYRGGLEDWRTAGHPIETNPGIPDRNITPLDGIHRINVEKSRIEWTGRNLTSAHSGTIKLYAGQIEIRDSQPIRGEFTLDMDSIENLDLPDSKMRQILIQHLKSDDFFDVRSFPTAEFRLSKITALLGARRGNPNWEVTGELTLKSVTNEIAFPVIIGLTPDGLIATDAHFDIDRTRWNVRYGSGKFYEKLGKHVVHDEVSLALKLVSRSWRAS
jgi:polyisoprenoid-binding protein YceI/rhodanese-related sulfurtransferase